MKKIISVCMMLCTFSLIKPAIAFQIGGCIVDPGDTTYQALRNCGEPIDKEISEKETIRRRKDLTEERIYTRVETWAYNLGSQEPIRFLRFEDDHAVAMWRGIYGGDQLIDPNFCNVDRNKAKWGMSQFEIRLKCGQPNDKQLKTEKVVPVSQRLDYEELAVVPIEEWTYNFGNLKPLSVLRFEDNVLKEIYPKRLN